MSDLEKQSLDPAVDTSNLMIEKSAVIDALQKLIDEYPSESIPRNVIRQAFMKVVGASDFNDLSGHPALQKLDEILLKAKIEYP